MEEKRDSEKIEERKAEMDLLRACIKWKSGGGFQSKVM